MFEPRTSARGRPREPRSRTNRRSRSRCRPCSRTRTLSASRVSRRAEHRAIFDIVDPLAAERIGDSAAARRDPGIAVWTP